MFDLLFVEVGKDSTDYWNNFYILVIQFIFQ